MVKKFRTVIRGAAPNYRYILLDTFGQFVTQKDGFQTKQLAQQAASKQKLVIISMMPKVPQRASKMSRRDRNKVAYFGRVVMGGAETKIKERK